MTEKLSLLTKRGKKKTLLARQETFPAKASGETCVCFLRRKLDGKWSGDLVLPFLCDPGGVTQPLWSESSRRQAAAHPAPQRQTRSRFFFLREGGEEGVKPCPTTRTLGDLLSTPAGRDLLPSPLALSLWTAHWLPKGQASLEPDSVAASKRCTPASAWPWAWWQAHMGPWCHFPLGQERSVRETSPSSRPIRLVPSKQVF